MIRRLILVCMAVCLLAGCASADSFLMPGIDLRAWEELPLRVSVRPTVSVVMPLDDQRTGEMNALLRHLSFDLTVDPREAGVRRERLSILTDGEETLRLDLVGARGRQTAALSSLPGRAWSSAGDVLALLLGEKAAAADVYGIREEHFTLPEDVDTLFEDFLTDADEEFARSKASENVKGFGKTTQRLKWSTTDTEAFSMRLKGLCPDGVLREFVSGLAFTGKQSLNLLANAEGDVLKLTYTGQCAWQGGGIRKVTLTWRRLRSDSQIRDDLTITSPALKGNDRDKVTFTRIGKAENGTRTLNASLEWEKKRDGEQTRILTAALEASAAEADGQWSLTGSASAALRISRDAPDEQRLSWSLTVRRDIAEADGTLNVVSRSDGHTVSDVALAVSLREAPEAAWEEMPEDADLDALTVDALQELRQQVTLACARDLIRALVLLPEEDTLYLSRDLPQWEQIVEAAEQALVNGGDGK